MRYEAGQKVFTIPDSDNIMKRVYANSFEEAVNKLINYEKEKGCYRAKAWEWIETDWNYEKEA